MNNRKITFTEGSGHSDNVDLEVQIEKVWQKESTKLILLNTII